jgi:hypothetical protein
MADKFLNAAGWTSLVGVAVEFGVGYLFAQGEKGKNKELLEKIDKLDKAQQEKLKQKLSDVLTESAKTEVIINFLNEQEIKKLSDDTKRKRIVPFMVLGFSVLIFSVLFLKLSRK